MKRSHDVEIEEKVEFDSLIQNKQLLNGLKLSGYERPSPIQLKAIPLGRLGMDLIAQAKSGTGKTVVFGVITLEAINTSVKQPQAMIVAPTREIAVQIRDVVRNLGQSMQVKCEAFIGGLSMEADCQNLIGCQVIVGTPGRLIALLDENKITTTYMKLVVLDEADKLMSDTFLPQIEFIFKKLKKSSPHHQTVTFSATFTDSLLGSLSKFLKSPQTIRLTEGVPVLNEVQQYYVQMKEGEAPTSKLSMYKAKFEMVEQLLGKVPFYQCMIFVNSLHRSMELSSWLNEMGWKSGHINSNLSQEKRLIVMEQMRDFKTRVLVCSDLIARGIDIDRVNLVINLDFPWEIETYLHRVGRTGRYGTSGIAINLIGPDDQSFLDSLLNEGIEVKPLPDKVSHNEYLKELSEEDKGAFGKHQLQAIQSKPILLSQERRCPVEPKKKRSKQQQQQRHVTPAPSMPRQQHKPPPPSPTVVPSAQNNHLFIPPDLYF